MNVSAQTDISYFQAYGDLLENSPLLTVEVDLLQQLKDKLPDETINLYACDLTQQDCEIRETDYEELNVIKTKAKPVYSFKSVPLFERSIALQKWEGIVTKIGKDAFTAKLINLTQEGYDEIADFGFEEITPEDLPQIKPGAVFYWTINIHHNKTGQRTKISLIRFRRLPVWSEEEISKAKAKAAIIANKIGWK